MNDLALITQVTILHNTQAFNKLVEKYQEPVRRFLLNLTGGNQAISDDLAQEVFIKAYTHLSSFKSLSNFKTWLLRIAYNVFYDYIRTVKETSPYEGTKATTTIAPVEDPSIRWDLAKALSTLSEEQRVCITLHLVEDVSISKIADITGWPQGTIKSHLSRGREKLTNYLKENGYER